MWLYMIGGFIVLLGLVGAALGGGIFTIVLIPIGAVIFITAVGSAMWGRSQQGAAGQRTQAGPTTNEPLPHSHAPDPGRAPTSPEALADERRVRQ
jgi:hypothetical protein